ncbi:MAG: DUF362 domain-containing protein [Spirochaetales bacterium]|nr:DUF362 domain-containing protein [Spirochaetales bacterium]
MNDNNVAVWYGEGPKENVRKALLSLDLNRLNGKSILIKPNIGRAAHPEQGINTHPQAIAGAIEILQQTGAGRIAIGESPIVGVDTMEAFKKAGIKEIADQYGIELIDLNAKKPVIKEISDYRILKSTKICADVYEFDIILSLPVAKCHMHTGVTLGFKNMKGCLYKHEKVRYHQLEYEEGRIFEEKTLDSAISDLATILRPDMTVIDGYIGMEGLGPSGGEAVRSDFAVASFNPMGADVFGCLMMGMEPSSVVHLKVIGERLGLSLNPDDYSLCGEKAENYTSHITKYAQPPTSITIEYPNIRVYDCESCSACLSTLMLFLKRFKDDMSQYLLNDGMFHIAIGKGLDDTVKEGTILIGNCTRNVKHRGKFVPGCPPVSSRIYKTITGMEPPDNEPEVK